MPCRASLFLRLFYFVCAFSLHATASNECESPLLSDLIMFSIFGLSSAKLRSIGLWKYGAICTTARRMLQTFLRRFYILKGNILLRDDVDKDVMGSFVNATIEVEWISAVAPLDWVRERESETLASEFRQCVSPLCNSLTRCIHLPPTTIHPITLVLSPEGTQTWPNTRHTHT